MDKNLKDRNTPFDNMDDDDIRVLGTSTPSGGMERITTDERRKRRRRRLMYLAAGAAVLIAVIAAAVYAGMRSAGSHDAPSTTPTAAPTATAPKKNGGKAYVSVSDTIINEIPLRIFTPHNAVPELRMGRVDVDTTQYVLGAMAADIGRDKDEWKVVSGFIYKGQLISHSISRWGYCAIIDGKATIGRELHTPLFEQCIDEKGDFFRHDALVDKSRNVSATRKGRAVRRALAMTGGGLCIVETETIVRLHDFAEALRGLDVTEAIGLMGTGSAVRWAIDKMGRRYVTGDTEASLPACVNYIVWRTDGQ